MYIGKRRHSHQECYDDYLEELNNTTISIAKKLSIIGVPMLAYYMYQDVFLVKMPELLYARSVFITVFILYILNSFVFKKHSKMATEVIHTLFLTSLMLMSVLMILITLSCTPFMSVDSRGALGALIVNTFVVFAFSGIASRWLHLIIGLPNILLILFFLMRSDISMAEGLAFLSNYIFIAIILIIRCFHQEYVHFDEFYSRYNYRVELNKNKELNQELQELATYDYMTGVYTRNAGLGMLEMNFKQAKREQVPLAIAFIDADGLKNINDTYGHDVGDAYLKKIVQTLKDHIRQSDYIIRFGGDEFIVVFYNCPFNKAVKIMSTAESNLISSGCEYNCDFSYGVSVSESEGIDAYSDLIKSADELMYIHKRKKRNHVEG